MTMEYIRERSCDFTNYPKLYEKTPWGYYNKIREVERPSEIIIGSNRNNVAESYKLKKVFSRISKKLKNQTEILFNGEDIRDHIEYYKTSDDKIVTIFSADGINDEKCKLIIEQGYIPVEPLYSFLQKSYLKVI
jgi:hypothetical protein